MKIIIEDSHMKTLKIGDMLTLDNVLYVVSNDSVNYNYAIIRIDGYAASSITCSNDLLDLTTQAKAQGYVIYDQDSYEFVIRRKK